MADIVVQAFAALILSLAAGLALVAWLNMRQTRELERSYDPGFRPQDLINAFVVCTGHVCKKTKDLVDATIDSVGQLARQVPTRMPVSAPARFGVSHRANRA